jgi:hypothetical protein
MDEILDALDESTQETKKNLKEFCPVVQSEYVQMKKRDFDVDFEWNTLLELPSLRNPMSQR